MERITQKHLDGLINRLNRITGSPATYCDKQADGKFKANIGHYHLDSAYGGVKLARVCSEGGGISCPIYMGYQTKREAYGLICAFIAGIEQAKGGE